MSKIEMHKFDVQDIRAAMDEIMNSPAPKTNLRAMNDFLKKQPQILEDALLKNAVPPIKGQITGGKLRWRGIRLNRSSDLVKMEEYVWITQRGVLISPKLKTTYSIKLPEKQTRP